MHERNPDAQFISIATSDVMLSEATTTEIGNSEDRQNAGREMPINQVMLPATLLF
jgi:hypothetical protein